MPTPFPRVHSTAINTGTSSAWTACPPTRRDTDCAEWQCSGCGGRWTVKDGHPGEAFAFWPPDIDAIGDADLESFSRGHDMETTTDATKQPSLLLEWLRAFQLLFRHWK
jgi:hypothetical protein